VVAGVAVATLLAGTSRRTASMPSLNCCASVLVTSRSSGVADSSGASSIGRRRQCSEPALSSASTRASAVTVSPSCSASTWPARMPS
jgi:hypothetical protein